MQVTAAISCGSLSHVLQSVNALVSLAHEDATSLNTLADTGNAVRLGSVFTQLSEWDPTRVSVREDGSNAQFVGWFAGWLDSLASPLLRVSICA